MRVYSNVNYTKFVQNYLFLCVLFAYSFIYDHVYLLWFHILKCLLFLLSNNSFLVFSHVCSSHSHLFFESLVAPVATCLISPIGFILSTLTLLKSVIVVPYTVRFSSMLWCSLLLCCLAAMPVFLFCMFWLSLSLCCMSILTPEPSWFPRICLLANAYLKIPPKMYRCCFWTKCNQIQPGCLTFSARLSTPVPAGPLISVPIGPWLLFLALLGLWVLFLLSSPGSLGQMLLPPLSASISSNVLPPPLGPCYLLNPPSGPFWLLHPLPTTSCSFIGYWMVSRLVSWPAVPPEFCILFALLSSLACRFWLLLLSHCVFYLLSSILLPSYFSSWF